MVSVDKAAIIWTIVIVIIAVEIAVFGSTSNPAHHDFRFDDTIPKESEKQIPQTSSISLQTDSDIYSTNDKITISGHVSLKLSDTPITIIIFDPNNDIVSIAQLAVDNALNFSKIMVIGGPLWEQVGTYTIEARYGEINTAKVNFSLIHE